MTGYTAAEKRAIEHSKRGPKKAVLEVQKMTAFIDKNKEKIYPRLKAKGMKSLLIRNAT